MSDISRRTLLGATGTAAAATVLTGTGAGTAQAAGAATAPRGAAPGTVKPREVSAPTTTTERFVGYVIDDDGEFVTTATFNPNADPGDMWAFVNAALARLRQQSPGLTLTGHVDRYDEVVTPLSQP